MLYSPVLSYCHVIWIFARVNDANLRIAIWYVLIIWLLMSVCCTSACRSCSLPSSVLCRKSATCWAWSRSDAITCIRASCRSWRISKKKIQRKFISTAKIRAWFELSSYASTYSCKMTIKSENPLPRYASRQKSVIYGKRMDGQQKSFDGG